MIIKEFSKHLQKFNADIPALIILSKWLKEKISKKAENNVEKILQKEIVLLKNKRGLFLLLAKSSSGQKLLESLYEFALSYDNYKFNKWLHKIKASDFILE
ncbi:MAG TPA: hypothetical protein P5556_04955 [Candidatus Gastranaerophilales bacterium]|nr:hypothetical protein [Candidatus Gastranaerophilales bacterium]